MPYTPNILIVDDEPRMCDSIKLLLSEENYVIFAATNGYDALKLLRNNCFDLVLLDLIMPEMDGYQVMREIKSHDPDILIIILTGHASFKSAIEVLKKGAYDYLRKPFEFEDLLKTVQNALNHKKTSAALKRSETRFKEMADLLPTIICETDLDMKLTYINKAGLDTFGYAQKEIDEGTKISDLLHSDDIEKATQSFQTALKGKNSGVIECRMLNKDGIELILLVNATRIVKNNQPNGLRISFTDFTEQKRLYARLQQALKMESVASLSGGIAHEFNNALMGITGNIELIQMVLPDNQDMDQYIEKIMSSISRMAQLTNLLLAYARGGRYWLQNLSIKDIVDAALPPILHSIDSSINVDTEITDDATIIKADLVQLQLVLSAVVANASESMDGPGKIKITAKREIFDDAKVKNYPGHKTGAYALLTIEDNGKGMDKTTKDRVFEPFFTTKFQGRGLTMAAVYGIVKSHNGWIGIESDLGKGTTVSIHLPAEKPAINKCNQPETKLIRGSGTIPYIDDTINHQGVDPSTGFPR